MFCSLASLGCRVVRPHRPPAGVGHGRLDLGTAVDRTPHQGGRAWLCYPRGLEERRGHTPWGLAPALGSALWPLAGPGACRLDRHCPGRSGPLGPLGLQHHAGVGLASFPPEQSARALAPAGQRDLAPPAAGGQPARPAVGRARRLLDHSCPPTHVDVAGALGRGLSRALAGPDRLARRRNRCRRVWAPGLDRVGLQRQHTWGLAWGADQNDHSCPGRAAVARPRGRDLLDGPGRLPGRSHPAAPGCGTGTRAPYGSAPGCPAGPWPSTQRLSAWPLGDCGGPLYRSSAASGASGVRTLAPERPCSRRAGQRTITDAQSSMKRPYT